MPKTNKKKLRISFKTTLCEIKFYDDIKSMQHTRKMPKSVKRLCLKPSILKKKQYN